jgi:DUF4097 and DUF4098 domain-containing protein YvlB
MSVNEERMFILKMLEDGKISSEEAAKLMEALDGGNRQTAGESARANARNANFQDEVFRMRERIHEWKKDFKNNYNQKDFDRMVDEFSTKAEKLGKNVANTTFGVVDKVIDFVGSFVDTNAFNIFGSYTAVDKSFEAEAVEGMDIEIEGVNAPIVIKKHADNKVLIKSTVKSPLNNADSILVFNNAGNKVSLRLNKIGNISVAHEIFVPALRLGTVKLETTNGRIYAEDSLSQVFDVTTRNAHIELMGVNSDKLSINTKNAKIQIGYVIGRTIDINTNNSVIDIKHIKAESVNAVTMNGKILVENVQSHENAEQVNLQLKTTNGDIKVNMNDMENMGYKVKAQTTNGGVNLLIPEMTYNNVNRQGMGGSFVEAVSTNYENAGKKVNIQAETFNGYIEVVK